jgi:adenine-specific DNA-methyltransferase
VPLPNLEFKFVAANSLIGLPKAESGLAESYKDIEILKRLREAYFTSYGGEKRDIEKRFLETQKRMFEHSLNWQTTSSQTYKLSEWNPFADEASSWFDPEWMFGLTSNSPLEKGDTGGCGCFDIAIANPPYVRHESIKSFKPQLAEEFDGFYCGTADLYTYFYRKGIDLLENGGHLCFIAPNKFMRAGYGKNTRKLLATEVTPKVIIDFCDLPIFDATTYPSIILVEKMPFVGAALCGRPDLMNGQHPKPGQPHRVAPTKTEFLAATFTNVDQLERLEETLSNIGFPMPVSALKEEGWNLERPEVLALMEKLRKAGTPLGEYVQGKFYYGIKTGLNEAFVIDAPTRAKLIAGDPKSEELIKRDDQGKFWWELRSCAYYGAFEGAKITWGNLATEPKFTFDSESRNVSAPAVIIPTDDLCLLSVLNSPLCKWWISLQTAVRSGGFLEYKPMYVETIPIVHTSDTQKAPVIKCVQAILANPDSPDVPRLEAEINKLVYDLYGLTPEEIAIVEGKR